MHFVGYFFDNLYFIEMASSKRKSCGIGDDCKQAGVANCEGCSRVFCTKHFIDHRRSLGELMNGMIGEYNDFKNTIIQEPHYSNIQPLIQKIADWEEESIKKIRGKAAELRIQLLQFKTTHVKNISSELQSLAEQIQKSQEQDDFIETDLRCWQEKLDDLKSNLTSSSMIIIHQNDDIPLVHDQSVNLLTTVNDESFDRIYNEDVRIEEDGKIVVSVKFFTTYTEIRGENNYAFGCHKIRLQIEHELNQWTFLGINSKSTPLQRWSFASKSAYGWCNSNYICSKGSYERNTTNQPIKMTKNDIITLTFDCDHRKISIVNERTNMKHELTVDINSCQFPWQFHVILRDPQSRIRILPA
jgi:hypothetical protein